jgi:hypothetical protein
MHHFGNREFVVYTSFVNCIKRLFKSYVCVCSSQNLWLRDRRKAMEAFAAASSTALVIFRIVPVQHAFALSTDCS